MLVCLFVRGILTCSLYPRKTTAACLLTTPSSFSHHKLPANERARTTSSSSVLEASQLERNGRRRYRGEEVSTWPRSLWRRDS